MENLSLVPRTSVEWLTTACNTSSRVFTGQGRREGRGEEEGGGRRGEVRGGGEGRGGGVETDRLKSKILKEIKLRGSQSKSSESAVISAVSPCLGFPP